MSFAVIMSLTIIGLLVHHLRCKFFLKCIFFRGQKENLGFKQTIVCHLPRGHLPPPKFGHLPPPKTVHLPGRQLPPKFFFFFFWLTFLGFFDLQLMEDIKDGREE